jgi:phosphoglycolate phosphatase-like HAD superfamily hydrolase
MLYLFDIDGTLLWSGGAGSRALERVFFARYQVAGAMRGIRCGGKTDDMIIGEMFRAGLGRDPRPGETAEIVAEYEAVLPDELARSEQFRLLPAVIETLTAIGGVVGRGLGIATGNTASGARAKLDRAGLGGRFHFGGYGCDSPVRSELVAAAIRRGYESVGREVDAAEIVVVGDTSRDIDAAQACGVRVVAVATGTASRDELEARDPDAVIDTLAELPAWHRSAFG